MTKSARLATVVGLSLIAAGLVALALFGWVRPGVPGGAMDFTHTQAPSQPVHVTAQTVGTIGFSAHPSWVSYLVKDPATHQWVQDTTWKLPAHSLIEMTIYQYDSGSPLRNQEFGQVLGVVPGSATLNGQPMTMVNSNTGNGVGHTFTVPQLSLSVPLYGVSSTGDVCGTAPCSTKYAHNIVKFSFRTPGPGVYSWQCIVPCGVGYLFGNGGPMSTQNYMGGQLEVVNVS